MRGRWQRREPRLARAVDLMPYREIRGGIITRRVSEGLGMHVANAA